MSNEADPHEPPSLPAFQWDVTRRTEIFFTGGPERVYDPTAADPDWQPRPVGFAPPNGRDPLLWAGDNA